MKKYLIFLIISVSLYSLHFMVTRHGIYGDGNGYFALAHTLFFQPRLDFGPVYRYLGEFHGASYVFSRIFWSVEPTKTGVLNCPWLIGPAIFWMPAFSAVFLASLIPGLHIGMFSFLYEYGCGLTGIILVMGGLRCIELALRRDFSARLAGSAVIVLYAGTQLFYYASFEPALAHQASFFLIGFILYRLRQNDFGRVAVFSLGLSFGLLAVTRMGEVILVLLPVGLFLFRLAKEKRFRPLALFTASCLFGILPQVLLQKAMYGSYLYNPYLHTDKGVFHPLLLSSLWNHLLAARGGFLVWSPVFLAAFAGMGVRAAKEKKHVLIMYAVSLLLYYLLISSWEYVPPAGFGNRFLIGAIPLLAYGLASFFRKYRKSLLPLLIFAIMWNALLTGQFFMDSTRVVDGRGLTILNLVTGQVTVPLQRTGIIRF